MPPDEILLFSSGSDSVDNLAALSSEARREGGREEHLSRLLAVRMEEAEGRSETEMHGRGPDLPTEMSTRTPAAARSTHQNAITTLARHGEDQSLFTTTWLPQ
ncbi:hypothetical protein PR202_gb03144 [Eleusine coracana subsp. coracana]|uniref:HNH endonuclease n=1 Tax=Eleusine coracana subsp. coracana TaxID=191504 RepID=A0AAV5DYR2_ELECO|nr:hypothetical protein PR202_gb03144 [Eleusine coracana subsp. coracana]